MRLKQVLPLLFAALSAFRLLSAQDISSPNPVVLPIAPATQYVVPSGQTRTIYSDLSVVLDPGTEFELGSEVLVHVKSAGVMGVIPKAPANGVLNADMNWTLSRSFDLSGNVIGESKQFFDNMGRLLQSQGKVFHRFEDGSSGSHVFASQPVYDALGRPALSTLPAPVNNSEFAYKSNFIQDVSGNTYTYQNYDLTKTDNPDGLGGEAGTLGWYYSSSNTWEPYTPTTYYPYSRQTYYSDGTGNAKKSAGVGEAFKMGSGHESSSYITPVLNELNEYCTIRNKYFPTDHRP